VNSICGGRVTDELLDLWLAPRGQTVVPHLEYVLFLVVDNRTWLEYHATFPRFFGWKHWIGSAEGWGVQGAGDMLHDLDLIVIYEQVLGGIRKVILRRTSGDVQGA
jgi:hypothetical protein